MSNRILKMTLLACIVMGAQTSANAQFGSLKGLANKAKKAVKEKVEDTAKEQKNGVVQQVENSGSQQTGMSQDNASSDNGSTMDVTSNMNDFGVNYSIAKQTKWNYESSTDEVLADAAYWLQRLRNSLKKGNVNAIDYEALSRINNGSPSFSFLDKQYHQWTSARNTEAVGNWALEKEQLVKAAWKLITQGLPQRPDYAGMVKGLLSRAEKASSSDARNYYFDRAFETTSLAIKFGNISAGDGNASDIATRLQNLYGKIDGFMKQNYPSSFSVADIEAFDNKRIAAGQAGAGSEEMKMKKGALLTQYKATVSRGDYKPMISGHDAGIEALVKKNCPEWGTILVSKKNTDYKVNYNAVGTPVSRYHTAVVVCQDQGYKVMHYIQLSQPYKGGSKYGSSEVRSGGMEWSAAVSIVK